MTLYSMTNLNFSRVIIEGNHFELSTRFLKCRSLRKMATGKVNFVNINFLRRCKSFKTLNRCQKLFYCTESTGKTEVPKIVSGFAASYEKQSKILNRPEVEVERFSTLLRHSKFIDVSL